MLLHGFLELINGLESVFLVHLTLHTSHQIRVTLGLIQIDAQATNGCCLRHQTGTLLFVDGSELGWVILEASHAAHEAVNAWQCALGAWSSSATTVLIQPKFGIFEHLDRSFEV